MLSILQRDILTYVDNVVNDQEYSHPKFIPVCLPRRFGKSRIAKTLKEKYSSVDNVLVVDNFEKMNPDKFFNELVQWFKKRDNVLIVLFTAQSIDHFSSTIINHYPCIRGIIKGENVEVTFPDNILKTYNILDTNSWFSTEKENEIKTIMDMFHRDLLQSLEGGM
jgi:hypothetical protein